MPPSDIHGRLGAVLDLIARDLARELPETRDLLREKIVLRTVEASLTGVRSSPRAWQDLLATTADRLQSLGLDQRTTNAWAHELLRAAGAPDDDIATHPAPVRPPGDRRPPLSWLIKRKVPS